MNDFLEKLLKIQSEYLRRRQLLLILDLISIFSIFYASFLIFQMEYFLEHSSLFLSIPISIIKITPPILAFIIAIIGALLMHKNDYKINIPQLIEDKYPELKEKLRTAYDNRDETNIIVDALKSLVLSGLTVVSASKLIATSVVVTKIILVTIFISGATTVSLDPQKYSIPPETLINISNTITGTIGNATNETIIFLGPPPVDTDKVGITGSGDIFGKPNIAPIIGKPVDLSLSQGLGEGNVPSEYKPDQTRFIRSAAFPVDVLGSNVSDGGYSILMKKTETEKKLIENYAVERSKI